MPREALRKYLEKEKLSEQPLITTPEHVLRQVEEENITAAELY